MSVGPVDQSSKQSDSLNTKPMVKLYARPYKTFGLTVATTGIPPFL